MFGSFRDLAFLGAAAGGGATPPLLDLYPGAAAAYSLRNLSTAYTGPVVCVRRSSDNTEQDFTASQVTDGTLTTFCGAGNGFVRTWYDQSGGGYHAGNSATGGQPQIVSSGAPITEGGKPAVLFDGTNDSLDANSLAALFSGANKPLHAPVVCKSNTASPAAFPAAWSFGSSAGNNPLRWAGQAQSSVNARFDERDDANPGIALNIIGGTITNYTLLYPQSTSSSRILRLNAAQVATGAAQTAAMTLNQFSIGCLSRTTKSGFWSGTLQEVVFYAANMTSSQGGIEANINAHYAIY
jgi:hypothetical protein